jgi:hypothetical protein
MAGSSRRLTGALIYVRPFRRCSRRRTSTQVPWYPTGPAHFADGDAHRTVIPSQDRPRVRASTVPSAFPCHRGALADRRQPGRKPSAPEMLRTGHASMTHVKPSMANATAPGSGISVRTPSTSQPAIRNARPAWKTSREPICFATRPASTNRPMPTPAASNSLEPRPAASSPTPSTSRSRNTGVNAEGYLWDGEARRLG